MIDEQTRNELFNAIKARYDSDLEHLRRNYLHKEVTLIDTSPPKSRGRAALIEDIMIYRGEPEFLCMVLRSGSETEFLNSEGWTRSYLPWSKFVILEEPDA